MNDEQLKEKNAELQRLMFGVMAQGRLTQAANLQAEITAELVRRATQNNQGNEPK